MPPKIHVHKKTLFLHKHINIFDNDVWLCIEGDILQLIFFVSALWCTGFQIIPHTSLAFLYCKIFLLIIQNELILDRLIY